LQCTSVHTPMLLQCSRHTHTHTHTSAVRTNPFHKVGPALQQLWQCYGRSPCEWALLSCVGSFMHCMYMQHVPLQRLQPADLQAGIAQPRGHAAHAGQLWSMLSRRYGIAMFQLAATCCDCATDISGLTPVPLSVTALVIITHIDEACIASLWATHSIMQRRC